MLKPEVLNILRCPADQSALTLGSESFVAEINAAIRRRQLRNCAGQTVERAFNGCLVRASGDLVYPIIDGIPVLVREEAIELNQLARGQDGSRPASPSPS